MPLILASLMPSTILTSDNHVDGDSMLCITCDASAITSFESAHSMWNASMTATTSAMLYKENKGPFTSVPYMKEKSFFSLALMLPRQMYG